MALLKLPEVLNRTAMCRSTVYELINRGEFPKPIKVYPGARLNAWLSEEVDGFIAERIADREKS